ncbi:hypothetical protein J6590_088186 [Homalodisca vitripennis]|nr:hypothetical protein J6590_088186 [Homalodisca vitripennis]
MTSNTSFDEEQAKPKLHSPYLKVTILRLVTSNGLGNSYARVLSQELQLNATLYLPCFLLSENLGFNTDYASSCNISMQFSRSFKGSGPFDPWLNLLDESRSPSSSVFVLPAVLPLLEGSGTLFGSCCVLSDLALSLINRLPLPCQ